MNQEYCQSCGMPMEDISLYGKEKDGSKSLDYCTYCYEDGSFRKPDETMEEMIETCIPFMKENGMAEEEARAILNNALPHLKRWSK
ncbi:zinc ribbon domain-containing protein [Tissierella sp. MB52-C2]|uniref:zinc ribbon domain-containing protein n=1 Tax=Tissierella sp. MB52-C2 TaxID=3070999 RepID=UPI00280B1057|nr:zinc ribbon domain-containing protein [Tissierella sp. MB52-C2]WMM25737.1 zinc ribbon domain-containing protein [Tissierella sp. MB52-C2]